MVVIIKKDIKERERDFSGLKQWLKSTAVVLPSQQRGHRYTESTVEALRFLQIQGRSLSLWDIIDKIKLWVWVLIFVNKFKFMKRGRL